MKSAVNNSVDTALVAELTIGPNNGIHYLRIGGDIFQNMNDPCGLLPGRYAIRKLPDPTKTSIAIAYRCRPGWVLCSQCKELKPAKSFTIQNGELVLPVCRNCGAKLVDEDLP